jgi:FeS assembly SUF system regulator
MLRLNKLTDYAVVLLSRMAAEPASRINAAQLASQTGIPEPTVAKILKELAKSHLVESTRGASGGYSLLYQGDEVTVRQVIEAIEGPIVMTDCVNGNSGCCSAENKCSSRGAWDKVNAAIIAALDNVTLADMMPQNDDKQRPLVRIAS